MGNFLEFLDLFETVLRTYISSDATIARAHWPAAAAFSNDITLRGRQSAGQA
jgi:hypothetical protein